MKNNKPKISFAFIKSMNIGDVFLIIFMAILLMQSAYMLFSFKTLSSNINSIDIIIRTTIAAIFGYFLSSNFARGKTALPQSANADSTQQPPSNSDAIPQTAPITISTPAPLPLTTTSTTSVPMQQSTPVQGDNIQGDNLANSNIATDNPQQNSLQYNQAHSIAPLQAESAPQSTTPPENKPQIIIAASVGLFSLLCLIIARNWIPWDNQVSTSASTVAIMAQFRDFVSGTVGFLIGIPTSGINKN